MTSQSIMNELIAYSTVPKIHLLHRYVSFIECCRNIGFIGYTEKHHIIPKSFNGSDLPENLIELGARHHFIAHLLLSKATGNSKMTHALHRMVYSRTGDVRRDYKITGKTYAFLKEEHSKIVSRYSKNTVVAKHIYTNEIKRIPKKLYDRYKNILYVALAKGRVDSEETRNKKKCASKKPRSVKQKSVTRSVAASKYSYQTPNGFCETSKDLKVLYPSFTNNTLTVIKNDAIITNKFASIHTEFYPVIGKTFEEIGITRMKRIYVKN